MSARTRYWTMHWPRVVLWPLPVLTFFKAGRAAANVMRGRYATMSAYDQSGHSRVSLDLSDASKPEDLGRLGYALAQ